LIASDYLTFRKSRRFMEGRSGLCGMGVCYECLVTIDGAPGQRACMVEVQEGMEIEIDEAEGL
jgi:aerobic-type carbon monoxide dehydrogenase small subunit (CoxS/CutS family)